MSEEAGATPVNSPEQKASVDARPSLDTPNFDAGSVARARAAVPLTRGGAQPSTLKWAFVALVAGMCGGLLGILVLRSYQKRDGARAADEPAAVADVRAGGAAATPAGAGSEAGVASSRDGTARAAGDDANVAAEPAATATAGGAKGEESAQLLRGALAGWIAATNARDIERQMEFYDARVGVFYLSRNASRAAVRAEKFNAFANASAVDVRAGEPQISLGPDGRTATMRFRKQYAIEGAGMERRGAVLQELLWRRTPAGWKITGERDLRIVD